MFTKENASEMGKRGNKAAAKKHGKSHLVKGGLKGGKNNVKKNGKRHMRRIGRLGGLSHRKNEENES